MNWRDVSRNPVDEKVHMFLLKELESKKVIQETSSNLLEKFVSGYSVLDIGVVEHDISHIESESWKHRKIKNWATKVVGVDILEEEVRILNDMGFDVRLVDATSLTDLGERFERVVIGDVIEHVSNPVALVEFAARHLAHDGLIMVSTPNPFYYSFIMRVVKEGTFIANAEHMSWVTPSMAIEIASRAGVRLKNYYPMIGRPKSILKRFIKKILKIILSEDNEIYASSYIYIFTK